MKNVAAILSLLNVFSGGAGAHDHWINNGGYRALTETGEHCCGENDCQSLREGEVQRIDGGYLIKATHEFVPDTEAQVGEDAFYWRCHRYDGSRRCFFTPTGGT